MVGDPMIKLFDIRTLKSLPPLPFPIGPSHLKFHPKLSSTILAASQNGQFQICDIANPNANVAFFQVMLKGLVDMDLVLLNVLTSSTGRRMSAVSWALWTSPAQEKC